jgi:hypothetical protein
MEFARVRDRSTGNFLFKGQPVPFVRLPARGDHISSPSTGELVVEGLFHQWTGPTAVADVIVNPASAKSASRQGEHTDPNIAT